MTKIRKGKLCSFVNNNPSDRVNMYLRPMTYQYVNLSIYKKL